MADIFISYSQRDRARVKPMADALEGRGLDVFWDPEIPPGETWDNVIARNLKASRCVIVVWSENSQDSDWVKEEAEFGKQKRTLVPVQIDNAGPPLGFTRIQTADLSNWQGEPNHPEWLKVLGRVTHHGADGQHEERDLDPRETREAGGLRQALYEEPGHTPSPPPQPQPVYSPPPPPPPAPPAPQPQMRAVFSEPQTQSQPKSRSAQPPKPASSVNWGSVFFNPQGRIGKGTFWRAFGLLLAANIALSVFTSATPELALIVMIANLAIIYPNVCVYGKRLHDMGKSAWLYLVAFLASMVAAFLMAYFAAEGGGYDDEILGAAFVGMGLVMIGFTFWVGFGKPDPQVNKHGYPLDGGDVADTF
ncbi:MAG: hypothetical protein CMK09_16685 [Ponticaulis sp.]|nr:hypothetical protein [Ponticaulis sp.]|tara:strand:- start:27971 stop:29059 length:1089 start_codon:yes stop_codon:yes gene_type:complete